MSALRLVSVLGDMVLVARYWGTSRFLMSALRLASAVARLGGHHGS